MAAEEGPGCRTHFCTLIHATLLLLLRSRGNYMGCLNGTGVTFSVQPGVNVLLLVKSAANTGPFLAERFTSLHQSFVLGQRERDGAPFCRGPPWMAVPRRSLVAGGFPWPGNTVPFRNQWHVFPTVPYAHLNVYRERIGHTPASHLLEKNLTHPA